MTDDEARNYGEETFKVDDEGEDDDYKIIMIRTRVRMSVIRDLVGMMWFIINIRELVS